MCFINVAANTCLFDGVLSKVVCFINNKILMKKNNLA